MLFISVGYPVGVDYENNYQIEIWGKIVRVSIEDFLFWKDIHKQEESLSDEQLKKCSQLRDLGLLIYAETPEELFPLVMDLSAIRQGAALCNEEGHRIFIANEEIPIPHLYYLIWGHSDGIRSLKNLYETLMNQKGALSKCDNPQYEFVCAIIMLAASYLIFFR